MRSVLFVDDEPRILDGLRRSLRLQTRDWELHFARSGDEALSMIDAAPPDVIVSDMRMPGMDGAELLRRVQERHPAMVRIILSGHTDPEAAIRAAPAAHQFLSKPCEGLAVREIVERAFALRHLLASPSLTRLVSRIDCLPAMPSIYTELVAATADPDVPLEQVAAIVERDVACTAKVLQLVNSSFLGLAKRVSNLRQAVNYIGVRTVRSLVLSNSVFKSFETSAPEVLRSVHRMQRHSLHVARVAQKLLPGDPAHADDAFMAGLLHDVGRLILITSALVPPAAERGEADLVSEHETFGVTHAELGAYLLGLWGLPHAIVEAVARHHRPGEVEHAAFEVVDAVHAANVLVHEREAGGPAGDAPPAGLDLAHLERLGALRDLAAWRRVTAEQSPD